MSTTLQAGTSSASTTRPIEDVQVTYVEVEDKYVVEITSHDSLETPDEDVGVFIGDTESDFCGDPQPVLAVNKLIDGAK